MMDDQKPYQYRVLYTQQGEHIHCRVFSRPKGQDTWANCGTLVVRSDEFISFAAAFYAAEFLEDER